jgi:uncharacterized protein YegL
MFYIKQNVHLKICFTLFLSLLINSNIYSTTKGLDLIVIVDQSGSMMGAGTKTNNDSEGVRNDMVRRILELMVQNGISNKVTHRLGVVSFGGTVRVDLPLSETKSISLEKMRKQLDSSLKDQSMGHTHFLAAFETVKNMFTKGIKATPGKRVIILITDGAPYIKNIKIALYVNKLRKLIESSFPYPDYRIHVVALNDPSNDYWEKYRDFWRSVSNNHARKLQGDKKYIFRALHDLINNITGTSAEHIPPTMYDNLVIPPYLESIVFDIFRIDTEVIVNLFPANDLQHSLTPDSGNVDFVNIGKTIQTVSVKCPVPGRWKIEKSNEEAKVDIYSQRFFPRGKLINPGPDALLRQYEAIFISYCVMDGDENPIKEIPGYPLTLELSLVKPDSSRIQIEMQKDLTMGESIYRTTREIECDLIGPYRTEVLIASKDLNDQSVPVFRDQWSGFIVQSAKLIDCKIVSPKPYEKIPVYKSLLLSPRHMYFKFMFIWDTGQPVNLPAVFKGKETNLLQISTLNKENDVETNFNFINKGSGILESETNIYKSPGQYHLKIRANKSYIPDNYTIRITPSNLFFIRYMNLSHWVQFFFIGLVILSFAFVGGREIWFNLRYPLRGTLYIDRLGGDQLKQYPLVSRFNRLTIKELPVQTRIKKIFVHAQRDRRRGITVTVLGDKKEVLLKSRNLTEKNSQVIIHKIPYALRYKP